MKISFSDEGWADYRYWIDRDRKMLQRLNGLLEECRRTPFKGTGKPEPLKGELAGWWSRRVTTEDRLIYRVRGSGDEQVLEVIQCRLHY